MNIYSAASMKAIDACAINKIGIPGAELMETAAKAVFDETQTRFGGFEGKSCAVFCGAGNNGGDGICVARLLLEAGGAVRCFLVGRREKMTADCREMERRFIAAGGLVENYSIADNSNYVNQCDFIFDAMFGIGLNSPMRSPAAEAAELINASPAKVIAVDIGSGVESDTGKILGCAVKADLTVTFTAPKVGHFIPPGGVYTGELAVCHIGIPAEAIAAERPVCFSVDEDYVNSLIPVRPADAHKGNFGKVLMLCGSVGFTGAAVMAAKAALRSGAGLVYVGVPEKVYSIVAVKCDEAMVFPLPDDGCGKLSLDALPEILRRLKKCDVCLAGPGLGRSDGLDSLVCGLISASEKPLVIDADGINALSGHIDVLKKAVCPIVLTPHDGEYMRLGGSLDDRLPSAKAFAESHGCVLIQKGHRTVTASPHGKAAVNTTGNPGMATGGSGDVLAGITASLIGQGLAPFDASVAAVWLHGRAGDICAKLIGQYGMLPSDMIDALPGLLP